MYVLGIETSTPVCGVGIAENRQILADYSLDAGVQHAERLISMVSQVLAGANLGLDAMSGVAVGAGPGSFTGLRIGMATAKGLCLAAGIPLLSIPTLAGIAYDHLTYGVPVCAMLDARRGQVYAGVYRAGKRGPHSVLTDAVLPLEEVLPLLPRPVIFAGQGSYVHKDRIMEWMGGDASIVPGLPKGGSLAAIGCAKVELGEVSDFTQVEPNYLRSSQAERVRDRDNLESAKIG